MKTFNTYINERLVLSKSKTSSIPISIKPIKRAADCSWKYLIIEVSVATLESLFGKPSYDCSKDSHFNFGVDKTSLSYYLSITGEVENKNVNYGITLYDYDAHEYDDEYELPIYNKNEVFKFHIGTPGNSNEIRDIILEAFNKFIDENNLSKEIKVYTYKFPWMP
jgi:hypothetical protein